MSAYADLIVHDLNVHSADPAHERSFLIQVKEPCLPEVKNVDFSRGN